MSNTTFLLIVLGIAALVVLILAVLVVILLRGRSFHFAAFDFHLSAPITSGHGTQGRGAVEDPWSHGRDVAGAPEYPADPAEEEGEEATHARF